MGALLSLRDSLSRFYGKYDTVIRLICKFLLAFLSFSAINGRLPGMTWIGSPLLIVLAALICAFLPSNSIVMVSTAMLLLHFYAISLEAALAGGGMLIIGCLLYFSIAPSSSVPVVLTALAIGKGIPCAVPVIFGLVGGPLAAAGVIFGTFIYYLTENVRTYGGSLEASSADAAEAMIQKMTVMMRQVMSDRRMMVMAVSLAVTLWVIWLFRRMAVKYAWMVAAVFGCLTCVLIRSGGALIFGLRLDIPGLILELITALIVAWLAQAFLFSLDYRRTENVRFEDEDYYYYVKAVPKRKIRRVRRTRRVERRER
ncbi:MAG: hypothetical protein Q4B01_00235 [Eubacteriales bacterium]|nr:hypothetical protein [Eubacteriales bacterium]